MRLVLNMIVRNEVENLKRTLPSYVGHIACYAILDTGSTDGTPEFIDGFFRQHNIPGVIGHSNFVNFEKSRNMGLALARSLRQGSFDYMLLSDADMELVTDKVTLPELTAPAYALLQKQGGMSYYNTRLLKRDAPAVYVGVTHEYLSVEGHAKWENGWWFLDHATGSNRKEKFQRDIRLLEDDLKEHPDNARSWFYLANSYRDAGDDERAVNAYMRRIELGGWDEEVWHAMLSMARSLRAQGKKDEFILAALSAYNYRPSRAESLHDLAKFHRERGDNALAWLYADQGSRVPYPKDVLFVEDGCYQYGFDEEKSIAGFYQERTRKQAFDACDKLALSRSVPDHVRENARTNLIHYLKPISNYAPSWKSQYVPFGVLDPIYTCCNPSITTHHGKFALVVRTVNYRIRPDGSYDMQGDSAIRTKNFLLMLNHDLKPLGGALELKRPVGLPEPKYPHVLGYEDVRIISWRNALWVIANMREQNHEGFCEQWLSKIVMDGKLEQPGYMNPSFEPEKLNQKNWMPLVDCGELYFMYRPGIVIRPDGTIAQKQVPALSVDHFAGGGQVVFWEGGFIALIHEARMDPEYGYSKRYYQHRFVFFDQNFNINKVSKPFFFERRQIEFAAGLAKHLSRNEFVVSYSTNDSCAKIGTISDNDLREFLWHG